MFGLLLLASVSMTSIQEGGRPGIPLGGLGTGSVELTPQGQFGRIRFTGEDREPLYAWTPGYRGLEEKGRGLPGAFAAVWTQEEGGLLLCGDGPFGEGFSEEIPVEFERRFPAAIARCHPSSELDIGLVVVGSIGLAMAPGGNEEDGKMPGFLLLFSAENRGDSPKEVAFCLSWRNITDEMGRFSNAGLLSTPLMAEGRPAEGILQTCHTDTPEERRPEVVLAVLKGDGDEITHRLAWDPAEEGKGFLSDFGQDGRLESEGEGRASALALRCGVAPGSVLWRPFALSWTCPSLCPLLEGGPRGAPRYLRLFGRADDVALRLLGRAAELKLGDPSGESVWSWLWEAGEGPIQREFLLGALAPLVRNTFLLDGEGLVVRRSAFEMSPVEADAAFLLPGWRPWVSLFPETMGEWIQRQEREDTSLSAGGFWARAGLLQWRSWTVGDEAGVQAWRDASPRLEEPPFLGEGFAESWVLASTGSSSPVSLDSAGFEKLWKNQVAPFVGLPMDSPSRPTVSQPDLWNSFFVSQMILAGRSREAFQLMERILSLKSIHDGRLGGSRVYAGKRRLLPLLNRESASATAPWEAVWAMTGCAWNANEGRLFLRPQWGSLDFGKGETWRFPLMTPFLRGGSEISAVGEEMRLCLDKLWTPEGEGLDVRRIELRAPGRGMGLFSSARLETDGREAASSDGHEGGDRVGWEGRWNLGGRTRRLVLTASLARERGTALQPWSVAFPEKGHRLRELRVNCGGDSLRIQDAEWKKDRPFELDLWGGVGGCSAALENPFEGPEEAELLLETLRAGFFSYLVYLSPDQYRIRACLPPPSFPGDQDQVSVSVNGADIHAERTGIGYWMICEPVVVRESPWPTVVSFNAPKGVGAFLLEKVEP